MFSECNILVYNALVLAEGHFKNNSETQFKSWPNDSARFQAKDKFPFFQVYQ